MRAPALLLAGALLAAGCSTDEGPALKAADPAAQAGGVLRIAATTPGSVDPGNVYEPAGELVARTLCTPLLGTDPETAQIVPGIVESYIVSDGGTTLTLRVRDDVVFSDGTPLTAQDVAFTLSRIASADYASTSAERLSAIDGYPEVHGDVPTESDLDRRRLRGVRASDEQNLQIELREPLADFVRVLTSVLTAPVSQAAAARDPKGFARQPLCVGPYALAEPYEPGDDALRLVPSEAYTPVDTALTRGGQRYPDAIEFHFFGDEATAAAAVAAGAVDVAPARPQDVAGVRSGPGPVIEYLGLPTSAEGFDDPRVRRAVALALDRDALVSRVFPGTREAADGFLPETSELDDACPALPPRGDVEAARSLVADVGVDVTVAPVPFYFNDDFRNADLVAEIARQLRDVFGITVVPEALTYAEFLAKGTGSSGFDGLFRFSWSQPYSDVDGYLHPLFSSDRIGRDNLSRFSDPDVDRTIDRIAREAEDDADRELGYLRVIELVCEQMPMVPLTTSLSRWLVSDRVGSAVGEVVDGSTGQLLVRELYLR
jgi:oligopeptide transport system substrate-binding protein